MTLNFYITMISENQVKKYCREDISLIENYDKAMDDKTQTWDCHHRKESQYSVDELVDIGEYYGVQASDLIFITHSDHSKLHNKLQDHHIGSSNPMFGKHHSEEARKKMSLRHKGRDTWMKGKHHSESTKKKLSKCRIGKHYPKLSQSKTGLRWFNNGLINVVCKECPDGFVKGRLNKVKHLSEETRRKMSEARKGKIPWNKGKHHSEETRQKFSEAAKGKHWYNNGVKSIMAKTCPEGFVPGRIVCNKR